jgi:hypothetical protein
MFVALFEVDSHEAAYVVRALVGEMPLKGEVMPLIYERSSDALGQSTIAIETPTPLTLRQRQFLTSCGFQFNVTFRED